MENVLINYIIKTVYGEGIIYGVLQAGVQTQNTFVILDLMKKFEQESHNLICKYSNMTTIKRKEQLIAVEKAFHEMEFNILTSSELSDREIYSCKCGFASISEGIKAMIVKLQLDMA